MKFSIYRKAMLEVLKKLRPSAEDGLFEITVQEDGTVYVVVQTFARRAVVMLEADEDGLEEGFCFADTRLVDVLQASREEVVMLSYKKTLRISDTAGMAITIPTVSKESLLSSTLDMLKYRDLNDPITALPVDRLQTLIALSKSFVDSSQIVSVRIEVEEGRVSGVVGGAYGQVESFPLGEAFFGEVRSIEVQSTYLKDILSLAGDCVTIYMPQTTAAPVIICDPDDPSWFALMQQIVHRT